MYVSLRTASTFAVLQHLSTTLISTWKDALTHSGRWGLTPGWTMWGPSRQVLYFEMVRECVGLQVISYRLRNKAAELTKFEGRSPSPPSRAFNLLSQTW